MSDIFFACSLPQELVQAFGAEAAATGKPQLMLTAAVSAGKGTIDAGYEIAEIAKWAHSPDGASEMIVCWSFWK